MIFALNSHISCQSLIHLEEKKNPVSFHHFETDVSFFLNTLNTMSLSILRFTCAAKISQNVFADGNFLYSGFKI